MTPDNKWPSRAWEYLRETEEQIIALQKSGEFENLSQVERINLVDKLARVAVQIADYIDKLDGVDPNKCKGAPPRYGTPNRKSTRYKMRKIMRYSYP